MRVVHLNKEQIFYIQQNIIGIIHNQGMDNPLLKIKIIESLLKVNNENEKYSTEQIHEIIQGKNEESDSLRFTVFSSSLRLAISKELPSVFSALLAAGDGWLGLAKNCRNDFDSNNELASILGLICEKPAFLEIYKNGKETLEVILIQLQNSKITRSESSGSESLVSEVEKPNLSLHSNTSSASTSLYPRYFKMQSPVFESCH